MSLRPHHFDEMIEGSSVVVKNENILAGLNHLKNVKPSERFTSMFVEIESNFEKRKKKYLLHNQLLAFPDKLIFGFNDSLKKFQVLNVFAMSLDAMNKVLNHFGIDFVAKSWIVLKNGADCLGFADSRIKKKVQMFVQQDLILLIAEAEILQEIMSEPHEFVHSNILFGVERNLKQIENDSVNADVSQQPLLVFARLDLTAW